MQQPDRTVIFGEAPEESDSEEIELNDDVANPTTSRPSESKARDRLNDAESELDDESQEHTSKVRGGIFGSSIFAPFGGSPQSTLARLAKYSPYELLSSTIKQPNLMTTVGVDGRTQTGTRDTMTTSVTNAYTDQLDREAMQQLPLLHRTLYSKNYQFRASMIHLHKHPLQVATKSVHSMSQGLVSNQKIIQEVNNAILKIQSEQKNLNLDISMIVQQTGVWFLLIPQW